MSFTCWNGAEVRSETVKGISIVMMICGVVSFIGGAITSYLQNPLVMFHFNSGMGFAIWITFVNQVSMIFSLINAVSMIIFFIILLSLERNPFLGKGRKYLRFGIFLLCFAIFLLSIMVLGFIVKPIDIWYKIYWCISYLHGITHSLAFILIYYGLYVSLSSQEENDLIPSVPDLPAQ